MARRSNRLLEAGYYREDGNPTVSYRETLRNTFRFHHHVRPNVHTTEYAENTHTTETETPNTAPHVTSHRTRTDRNNTRRWTVGLFILCFLLFIGLTSMFFQLRVIQQDIDTLAQLVDECQNTSAYLYGRILALQFGYVCVQLFTWM